MSIARSIGGRRRPGVYVDFASPKEARKVLETHQARPFRIDDTPLKIRYAQPTAKPKMDDILWQGAGVEVKMTDAESSLANLEEGGLMSFKSHNSPSRYIQVSGLPHKMTREEIFDLFEPWGEIKHIRLGT